MSLLRTTLWMICLAQMVLLIPHIRADAFTTIPEVIVESTEAMKFENYKISSQQLQHGNTTTKASKQTKDELANSKLLSPINNSNNTCNENRSLNTSNIPISELGALIQSWVQNITNKNITITKIFHEFENETSHFMEEPDSITGENAIERGNEYIGNTTDFLIAIQQHNSLVRTYKCMNKSKDVRLQEISQKRIQGQFKHNEHIIREFEYLYNLTLLHTSIYYKNEDAFNFMDEYNTKRDLDCLRKAIIANEETKKLIDEYIPYLEEFYTFMGNKQLFENFSNTFTEHLTDKIFWEEQAVNSTKDLERNKKYLSEETHRILIQERIQPATQGIIFIIGFVGNVILLIIFARHEEIRIPQNMMILNLAIGDALNLIINIPTFYTYYMSSTWDYGEGLCKAFRFFRQLGIAVSVYSIVMISIQRFLALNQLFKGSRNTFKMSTRIQSALVILSVWIIATILATPHTVHAGVYNGNCYGASAEIHAFYSTFITLFDFILFCTIPVTLIIILSLSAAYMIKRSVKNMPGESLGMDKLIKARTLSSNVLISLTFVSAISYIPLYLFMIIYAWSDIEIESSQYIVLFFVLYSLQFANCCFNPIALYIFSRKFRKYFDIYLRCRKLSDEEDSSKQSSTGTNVSSLDTKM